MVMLLVSKLYSLIKMEEYKIGQPLYYVNRFYKGICETCIERIGKKYLKLIGVYIDKKTLTHNVKGNPQTKFYTDKQTILDIISSK